jgi:hypothetical protein
MNLTSGGPASSSKVRAFSKNCWADGPIWWGCAPYFGPVVAHQKHKPLKPSFLFALFCFFVAYLVTVY